MCDKGRKKTFLIHAKGRLASSLSLLCEEIMKLVLLFNYIHMFIGNRSLQ